MHLESVTIHPETFPVKDQYPFQLAIFDRTRRLAFTRPVTFFVGENGAGKSTLLKAIARRCGVNIWQETERRRFKYNPYEEEFHRYVSINWVDDHVQGSFFGSEFFTYFTQILDEWASADPGQLEYFGGRSLTTLSHGQSLMAYFRSRYRIKGLYFLDEPETALSPRTQLELLRFLEQMSADGHAQFIIASHSPLLLACAGAMIYSFDETPIKEVPYEETTHYRIYRRFLEDRHKCLEEVTERE
ncbi:MAG: AAA family ATPase [Thermodesulfobacteriota bacterium]